MATQRYQSLEVGDENEKVEAATHHNYGLKISSMQALLIGMVFFILLCFAAYASIALVDNQSGCLGAPYLYISHHDNHNVQKYTRDGCPVSPNVLRLGRTLDPAPSSIRSLIIHSYKGVKNALFVANAGSGTDFGRILVFDNCAGLNGMRPFLKTLVDQRTVSGAQHTCSISFDRKGDMYASFQNTDAVLRFSNSTYQPKSSPYQLPWFDDIYSKDDSYNTVVPISNSRNYTSNSDYFPGTFVQFGYPGLHDDSTQGMRAIVWVGKLLWIANEDLHRIIIVDSNGKYVGKVKVKNPVGLIYNQNRNLVFVGSKKGSKSTGSVYGIDTVTQKIVKTFTLLGGETMNHPTGLAVSGDTLFVGEQSMDVVLTFNVTTERFLRQIIGRMNSGGIESIVLSDC